MPRMNPPAEALHLKLGGFTYEEIGERMWVGRARAHQLVVKGARVWLGWHGLDASGKTAALLGRIRRAQRNEAIEMWINEQRNGLDFLSQTSEGI